MEKELLIQKAKQAYKEYCEAEWEEEYELVQGNTLSLMYTTINDEEYEVQVDYNLEQEQMIVSISNESNEYIFKEKYSLENILFGLEHGDWDGWYSYAHDVCDSNFKLDLEW